MDTIKLYESLVLGITDAILDEAYAFKTGKIQGVRFSADEAFARRPPSGVSVRDPRDISDATRSEHERLKSMLDTNTATRKDGTSFPLSKGLRDKLQGQFDAIQNMIGAGSQSVGRDEAAAKLDSIMAEPTKTDRPKEGADAFAALFAS